MLLQEGMHLHPGLEAQHSANFGFRQAFRAVSLEGQCFQRNSCRILVPGSDLSRKLVRNVESDLHNMRIARPSYESQIEGSGGRGEGGFLG